MSKSHDEARYQHGLEVLQAFAGEEAAARAVAGLQESNPALAHHVIENIFGELYANSSLSPRDRQLMTLGILVALGDCEPQLVFHVQAARNAGIEVQDIMEIFLHASAYVGVPRAMNASVIAHSALADTRT